ncbi:MAG: EF-hand domain-containing protein [Verrucomicrobiota bacterium]|nr:EF-hand domain-containing protein [Verrucomicrobiota bacterium]
MTKKQTSKLIRTGLALAGVAALQTNAPAAAKAKPTFTEDIAPIIYNNCTECHRNGQVAPFTLQTYSDVKKRARLITKVTENRYMPPWHPVEDHGKFVDERRLTGDELATLKNWYKSGMAEGPADKLPEPPEFASDWLLGEPDMIVKMPKAYTMRADGSDIYRSFVIPLDLKEDKWVTGFEVRPSARAVLHHVIIRIDQTGEARKADGARGTPGFSGMRGIGRSSRGSRRGGSNDVFSGSLGGLGGWAVGGTPRILPLGLARKLPAGADIVLNSHFHPSGKEEDEQTTIGLYFTDKKPERTLIGFQVPPVFGSISGIDIPAGESNYELTSKFTTPVDIDLIGVGAHMHYIGHTAKAHATLPDGTVKSLFYIDDWDFNWQGRYTYDQPIRLPAGTTVEGTVSFDNSATNPHNPFNPPRRIKWGLESTDEMGSVIFSAVPADEADLGEFNAAVRDHVVDEARLMAERRFDERAGGQRGGRGGLADRLEQFRSSRPGGNSGSRLGGDWRGRLGARLKELDKNNNGEIEPDEIDDRSRRTIRFIDTNKDGRVSKEELSRISGR